MAINTEELRPYAYTDRQRFILDAIDQYGGQLPAAKALNISNGTVSSHLAAIRKAKEEANIDEAIRSRSNVNKIVKTTKLLVSDTYSLSDKVKEIEGRLLKKDMSKAEFLNSKSSSTLYDANGNVKLQWVKTDSKESAIAETIKSAMEEFYNFAKPVSIPVVPRPIVENKLLAQYTITDYHLGMFADMFETHEGKPWNTDIATAKLAEVVDRMVNAAPYTERAVINILGDFLHYDSEKPITPAHGHVLSADARPGKLIRLAIKLINHAVMKVLEKAENVTLIISQGNHDPISSLWLQNCFAFMYSEEENVEVVVNSTPWIAYEWGNTLLAYHHGHRIKKLSDIAIKIPNLFPVEWGATTYRYCHVGHHHHQHIEEVGGIIIERHQTLAPNDDYASGMGLTSQRGANLIIYSQDHGEVSRMTFRP